MRNRKIGRQIVQSIAASTAAVLVTGASSAMAAYTGTTTFQEVSPAGGPYPLSDPANWTNGLPTASTLAILANANTAAPAAAASPLTAYSLQYANTAFGFSTSGQPITLTSTDSVVDTTAMTSPALHYASTGVGEFQINNNIILGNGSVPTGTAYVKNDGAARLLVGGNIRQAPGTSWGLTLLPASTDYRFRSANNSGNYLTNRFIFSGPLTITAGADVRVFTNLLPYGAGLPNTVVDGRLRHSANANAILINAIDGGSAGVIERTGGDEFVVGANNANGTFAGTFISTATRLNKVGSGMQTLSGTNNAFQGLAIVGPGGISGSSVADTGVNSAFGRAASTAGNFTYNGTPYTFAGTILDGGTMQYTGPAGSTNRPMDVSFRGATLDASGTGGVTFSGAINSTDLARAWGDQLESGTSSTVPNMYGIEGLGALASQLVIANVNGFTSAEFTTSIFNAVGTTPVAIDETNRTMQLAAIGADGTNPALVGFPGNNQGAPRVDFLSKTGLNRTLNLTGTNTADNTIAGALGDSALGGKLGINKTGAGTWVLSGANTYTGPTTVNGGKLAVTPAAISAGSAITVNGGTYEMCGSATEFTGFAVENIAVNSGGTAALAPSGGRTALRSNGFVLNGTAKLDLTDNKLITRKPVGTATTVVGNTRTYDGLQGMVQSAKAGDTWSGPGLTSSKAAVEGGLTTIGIANGAQAKGGIGATETALWGGQTVTGSDILAMYTYAGDANLDGAITGDDYSAIDFGILFPGMDGYANGDFNYDGYVTGDDYSVIDLNILLQGPQIPTGGSVAAASELAGVTAVPEPASLGVIAVAGAALLGRRRRRRS